MPAVRIPLDHFLAAASGSIILDVRSPAEYAHAHIPGAVSLPLFTDEERKTVGTQYKQVSREAAIKSGLDYFGPRMRTMVETAEALAGTGRKPLLVHCWRGGMRSAAVAWLLDLYGFEVSVLEGGYKTFRRWALQQFHKDYRFRLIGGYTGSGKTELLQQLQQRGDAVIDLEGLAAHKGSAFGGLDKLPQPSTEMFENMLALELHRLTRQDAATPIWVEDESQRIGDLNMPAELWKRFREQPLYFLEVPFEERLDYLVRTYGHHKKEQMINAMVRIQKRLGPLETKTAVNYLLEGDVRNCFGILLRYYDKQYDKALANREHLDKVMKRVACERVDAANNTIRVLNRLHESGD